MIRQPVGVLGAGTVACTVAPLATSTHSTTQTALVGNSTRNCRTARVLLTKAAHSAV